MVRRAAALTACSAADRPSDGRHIGALPLTVARDAGFKVAYLPGLSMRRIADLYPGEAKTDAKDAAVIADAARTMPHTLRSLELTDEITAELTVLVGFDQDMAAEATRTSNRIRGLLTQFHPSLEHVLGPRLDHQWPRCWTRGRSDGRCRPPGSLKNACALASLWPAQARTAKRDRRVHINRVIKLVARAAFVFRNATSQRLRTRCVTTRRTRGHIRTARRPA